MPYQSLMGLSKDQLLIRFFHLYLSLKKGQSWFSLSPFTGCFKLQGISFPFLKSSVYQGYRKLRWRWL